MKLTDLQRLEEAYISISKKTPNVPADKEKITTEPNEVVSAGPVSEPAPGVDMDMIDSEVTDVEPEDKDTTGIPVSLGSMGPESQGDPRFSEEDENEEDSMAIENLHSIRESIMKIAAHCAKGEHLEPWQQQKLAIAMDNLAEIARRIL